MNSCFSYLQTITLSLYLFNLLPLPFLDGSQLLSILLLYMCTTEAQGSSNVVDEELELIESGVIHREDKPLFLEPKARIKRAQTTIERVTIGLLALCIVLSLTT
jgi:S2P endopeptidase